MVSRFKIVQVGVMVCLLPVLSGMYITGYATAASVLLGFVATSGSLLVLAGLSYGFSRLVGELGYCEDSETVCLSTLTFMARRKNALMNVDKVVPFFDCNKKIGWFQRFVVIGEDGEYHTFYYSPRYGIVMNSKLLKSIVRMKTF